jgi:hypothetical protein
VPFPLTLGAAAGNRRGVWKEASVTEENENLCGACPRLRGGSSY